MPQAAIIFGNQQESGDERLSGASPEAINVVVDGKRTVRRRPGIAPYDKVAAGVIDPNGIDGLHVTNGGKIFAAGGLTGSSRLLYRLAGPSIHTLGGPASDLIGGRRPVFAETEALVVIAAGSRIQKIVLSSDESSRLGGDPPEASHVTANALRLEANDVLVDRSKVRYSDIATGNVFAGHEDWSFGGFGTAGFFSAEARPDPIQWIGENTNELFVGGTSNVQIFGSDPSLVFAPLSTREYGTPAPYSVINVDQMFAWLDHRRRFVVTDGRTFDIISDPIGTTLDSIADVSDCFGYRVYEGQIDMLVWTFPSDGRTFAFQKGGGWGQWQGRDLGNNNWEQLQVSCHHHRDDNDDNIVGTPQGEVGILQPGRPDDLGTPITSYVETGFYSRGTDARKLCKSVYLTFRRGLSQSGEVIGTLTWADAPGKWGPRIPVQLGVGGDTQPVIRLRSLGVYRRRAWRFEFSAEEDLVLSSVEEEFDVLDQ